MKNKFKLLIVIILTILLLPFNAEAETLNDAIAEADQALANAQAAKNKRAMTAAEKDKVIAERQQVIKEQETLQKDIEQAQKDIVKMNKQIKEKEQEIKKIVNYVQVSNGESSYLEYVFDATDFTDLIYRAAVAEELTNYNDKLIDEFNSTIKKLENKKIELANKKKDLKSKEKELQDLETKLGEALAELSDEVVTKEEAYKAKKDYANMLKSKGCKGTEQISVCLNRVMGSSVISSNGAYLPFAPGRVTSNFGYGDSDRGDYHKGMDFSSGSAGTNVYAIANGQVVAKFYRSCGQNFVYVIHTIAGVKYTSAYLHLGSVSVGVGQSVTYNTKIGSIGPTDTCSSGPHLHIGLTRGWAVSEYSLGSFNSKVINPRTVLKQAPAQYSSFSSRG